MRYADMLEALPRFSVDRIVKGEEAFSAAVHLSDSALSCPRCSSAHLLKMGSRDRSIKDVPYRGKPVVIVASVRRFKCGACGVTFMEPIDGVDEVRRMTTRLVDFIWQRSFEQTFTGIAKQVGVVEATVRLVFSARLRERDQGFRVAAPRVLALDRFVISSQPGVARCVATNVGEVTLLDVMDTFDAKLIGQRMKTFADRDRIEYVVGPIDRSLRSVCRSVTPRARYCLNREALQHVWLDCVLQFRRALRDSVGRNQRSSVGRLMLHLRQEELAVDDREEIQAWAERMPAIRDFWFAKKKFDEISKAKSRERAEVLLDKWLSTYAVDKSLTSVVRALRDWRDEFLMAFEVELPKKYLLAVDRFKKACGDEAKLIGWRGHSFDVFRASLVHESARKYAKGGVNLGVDLGVLIR